MYRKARKSQGFNAVKMNGTEDLGWLDSPSKLDECVERVKAVRAQGLDAGVDFHGRVHKPMAKQLVARQEPHHPLFVEEPLLSENIGGIKDIAVSRVEQISPFPYDLVRFSKACSDS